MNIYIELEVVKRELFGKLLLSLELIDKNFTVYLTTRESINELAKKNKISPGIIFLKDANTKKYRINDYKKLIKNNFVLVSQDEEIGCFDTGKSNDYSNFFIERFDGVNSKAFNYINKFFCWGDFDYNFLKKFNFKTEFIKTGSPRIDLCKINKEEKKTILIPLNQRLFWKRGLFERYHIEVMDSFQFDTYQNILKKYFFNESRDIIQTYHLIELILKLSKLKGYNIVLRPHPAHNIKKILSIFSDKKIFKNIKITDENSLIEEISKSEIIIQFGCTSSVEATLNNKMVILQQPNDPFLINYKKNFLTTLGFSFGDSEKLIKFVKSKKKNKSKISNQIKLDKKNINKRILTDGYSYSRIVSELKKIKIQSTQNKLNSDLEFKKIKFKSTIKQKIKKKMLKLLKQKPLEENVFEAKFPKFNKSNIEQRLKLINNQFNINSNFNIDVLNERCLKIYNKKNN
tara:strand:+ start:515 stop:1891 length:1377 start_codon:yes stop_codon:yes gene_type:complete